MTVEKMNKLPYLKRQPTGHKSSSFCDGTFKLTDEELAAYRFFEKVTVDNKKDPTPKTGKENR